MWYWAVCVYVCTQDIKSFLISLLHALSFSLLSHSLSFLSLQLSLSFTVYLACVRTHARARVHKIFPILFWYYNILDPLSYLNLFSPIICSLHHHFVSYLPCFPCPLILQTRIFFPLCSLPSTFCPLFLPTLFFLLFSPSSFHSFCLPIFLFLLSVLQFFIPLPYHSLTHSFLIVFFSSTQTSLLFFSLTYRSLSPPLPSLSS